DAVVLRLGAQHPAARLDLPALGGERVARKDDAGEARREALQPLGVAAASLVEERAAGEAVGAEPVEYRPIEPGHLGELRRRVERVQVAGQTVEERLLGMRALADREVGRLALGRVGLERLGAAVAAETAGAADEDRERVVEDRLALVVGGLGDDGDDG